MEARDNPAQEGGAVEDILQIPQLNLPPDISEPPSLSYTPDLLPNGSGSGSGSGSGAGVMPSLSSSNDPTLVAALDDSLLSALNAPHEANAAALDDAALYSMVFSYQPDVNPLEQFDIWNPPTTADE